MASTGIDMDYESDMRSVKRRRSCCCSGCNSQIFCSYVISILSSLLIAGGFYLSLLKWDHLWLILPIAGSILIFIGACMYYSGQQDLNRKSKGHSHHLDSSLNRRRRRQNKDRHGGCGGGGDNLISSALNGDSRSLSQLSINMIPQYFANSEIAGAHGSSSMPYSQILRVNGQSFLILPLSGESGSNPGDTAISLQNFMVKMPCTADQQSKPGGTEVTKKSDDLPHRPGSKGNPSEGPSSSSQENRLSNCNSRHPGRENEPTTILQNESHQNEANVMSCYFAIPSTSSAGYSGHSVSIPSGEAGQSRNNNNHSPLPSSSSSSASPSRRPLLRRGTFSKSKPSISSSNDNQLASVDAQTTASDLGPNSSTNTSGSNNNPVTSSLRMLSTRDVLPDSANSSSEPQPGSSGEASTIVNAVSIATNNTTTNQLGQLTPSNPDETFFVMCGGGGGNGTGGDDDTAFDESLIDPGTSTPPPSYEEVLSVDIARPGRNSVNFDTL